MYCLWPVSSVSVGLLCGLTCLLFVCLFSAWPSPGYWTDCSHFAVAVAVAYCCLRCYVRTGNVYDCHQLSEAKKFQPVTLPPSPSPPHRSVDCPHHLKAVLVEALLVEHRAERAEPEAVPAPVVAVPCGPPVVPKSSRSYQDPSILRTDAIQPIIFI